MKSRLNWFDRLRLAALPIIVLPPLGIVWLRQAEVLSAWLIAVLYSDQLTLSDAGPTAEPTSQSKNDLRQADQKAAPVAAVIPVCLAEDRVYNVEDALWAAILAQENTANRVRFPRCLEARKRSENWKPLREQLVNARSLLLEASGRVLH